MAPGAVSVQDSLLHSDDHQKWASLGSEDRRWNGTGAASVQDSLQPPAKTSDRSFRQAPKNTNLQSNAVGETIRWQLHTIL